MSLFFLRHRLWSSHQWKWNVLHHRSWWEISLFPGNSVEESYFTNFLRKPFNTDVIFWPIESSMYWVAQQIPLIYQSDRSLMLEISGFYYCSEFANDLGKIWNQMILILQISASSAQQNIYICTQLYKYKTRTLSFLAMFLCLDSLSQDPTEACGGGAKVKKLESWVIHGHTLQPKLFLKSLTSMNMVISRCNKFQHDWS